jgi:hypothetical protein
LDLAVDLAGVQVVDDLLNVGHTRARPPACPESAYRRDTEINQAAPRLPSPDFRTRIGDIETTRHAMPYKYLILW